MAAPVSYVDLSVLVLDNSQEMRALLREMLGQTGIKKALEARDYREAIEEMKNTQVDVILVDSDLEPVSGVETVKNLRDRSKSPNPFVPIIMVTGQAIRDRVFAARDAGVHEFLLKPFSANALRDRITKMLQANRAFIQAESYFGPDRRRTKNPNYKGPERRKTPG
ncbi:MAG: response regulator [Proteobacteria bacterium]|nr:response regulator [Pseudomonadota bacterium]